MYVRTYAQRKTGQCVNFIQQRDVVLLIGAHDEIGPHVKHERTMTEWDSDQFGHGLDSKGNKGRSKHCILTIVTVARSKTPGTNKNNTTN